MSHLEFMYHDAASHEAQIRVRDTVGEPHTAQKLIAGDLFMGSQPPFGRVCLELATTGSQTDRSEDFPRRSLV